VAEKVVERPALSPPGPGDNFERWASAHISQLLEVFQQYGYRLNRVVDENGLTPMQAPIVLAAFAVANLPPAADWEGAIIYVTDGGAGEKFRGSDNTSWVMLG